MHGSDRVSCHAPASAATLADFWLGLLPPAAGEAIEEHLLACDSCGDRLREVIALAAEVRNLAREGTLRLVVTETFIQCAAAEGLRIREYAPPPGGGVECTVAAEDQLLITRLAADLRGARRVDLCFCDEHGAELHRAADIPVAAGAAEVIHQESIAFAKASPTARLVVRLLAVEESGAERLLGEYTFHHTRTLPGPGAW
jgi:hypothetical protein